MVQFRITLFLLSTVIPFSLFGQISSEAIKFKGASPAQQYSFYCSGCHGDKMEKFKDKTWHYGKNKNAISQTIKYGREDLGMPAFEATFSDNELEALSAYVLEKADSYHAERVSDLTKTFTSEDMTLRIDTVVSGLKIPWGLAFLPNGDLLITEREGRLLRVNKDGDKSEITGLPTVYVRGQGGLMDVRLHPDYNQNGWIYFSYAAPAPNGQEGGNTAVFRAQLKENTLTDIEHLFKGMPNSRRGQHYGSRIVFKDGYIFFSIGDRGNASNAQGLTNHCGKIHRIYDDGRIPKDNPFVSNKSAMPTIWSYGHRNPQGLAFNPATGDLWANEHGPRGGDELNIVVKEKNYGWPDITFGINYNGTIITEDTIKPGMELPVHYWIPSIAPCGMTFTNQQVYPNWGNSVLSGSLRFRYLERCELKDDKVVKRETLLKDIGRVRNVVTGPDGMIYVAIENPGYIIRITPQNR